MHAINFDLVPLKKQAAAPAAAAPLLLNNPLTTAQPRTAGRNDRAWATNGSECIMHKTTCHDEWSGT